MTTPTDQRWERCDGCGRVCHWVGALLRECGACGVLSCERCECAAHPPGDDEAEDRVEAAYALVDRALDLGYDPAECWWGVNKYGFINPIPTVDVGCPGFDGGSGAEGLRLRRGRERLELSR
jgi:hypothetical protein